jgi:hypothetical protein
MEVLIEDVAREAGIMLFAMRKAVQFKRVCREPGAYL